MLDYQDFKNAVSELERFYKGEILNGGILESAWYETLKRLSLSQLQTGIARCFLKHPRKYNFFPSSGQILEFAVGEYRPPGECLKRDFSLACLPSEEQRMSSEEKAEAIKRGRLTATIIVNSSGFMSVEQKDKLIENLRQKPTYELEMIASTAKQAQKQKIGKRKAFSNISTELEKVM
jgi:hypothetical protein